MEAHKLRLLLIHIAYMPKVGPEQKACLMESGQRDNKRNEIIFEPRDTTTINTLQHCCPFSSLFMANDYTKCFYRAHLP